MLADLPLEVNLADRDRLAKFLTPVFGADSLSGKANTRNRR